MGISDWSSDVCSSDLATPQFRRCTESAVDEDANVLRPNRGPEEFVAALEDVDGFRVMPGGGFGVGLRGQAACERGLAVVLLAHEPVGLAERVQRLLMRAALLQQERQVAPCHPAHQHWSLR